uniref:Amidase domain-containing protein n=1 Tax=Timema douglasi TaxID=61478 RepID=A0A7R8VKQ9_TIMDO|nr:unnamed protein product [Timema douglasi]
MSRESGSSKSLLYCKPVDLNLNPSVTDTPVDCEGEGLKHEYYVTSEEVVQAYIARAREVNPLLNAVVEDRYEAALAEARSVDHGLQTSARGVALLAEQLPLLGVPFTVKESIALQGLSNVAGQVRMVGQKAREDAEAVRLLREAGAIPLLVSNTPEMCMHLETDNRVTGRTNNPYDLRRTPGGSSGGEAALLGSAASVISIGSDICGSLRIPALFCGIFGHKPTPVVRVLAIDTEVSGLIPSSSISFCEAVCLKRGQLSHVRTNDDILELRSRVVSISGHVPTSSDKLWPKVFVIGPMVRYAEDLPLIMRILANENCRQLRLDQPVDLSSLKIYFLEDDDSSVIPDTVQPDIKMAMRKVINHMKTKYNVTVQQMDTESLRNSLIQLSVPILAMDDVTDVFQKKSNPKENKSMCIEVFKYLMGLSDISLPVIMYGMMKRCSSSAVSDNERTRMNEKNGQLKKHLKELLSDNAVFLYPTTTRCAPFHKEMHHRILNITFTIPCNTLGLPATSCPVGLNDKGLPVGIQVIAGPCQDRLCLALAKEIETAFGGWIPPPDTGLVNK